MAQEIKKKEAAAPAPARYIDPFNAMRAEMDRVFDSFLGRGFGRMPSLFGEETRSLVVPDIDIRETASELVLEAELPGMAEKDVSLSLRNGVLTLKGEKKSEREDKGDQYHVMERSYGRFERSFELPETVDEEKISAAFANGILKITMPKRPETVRAEKKIPVGRG
jgi:HSP20 family protein